MAWRHQWRNCALTSHSFCALSDCLTPLHAGVIIARLSTLLRSERSSLFSSATTADTELRLERAPPPKHESNLRALLDVSLQLITLLEKHLTLIIYSPVCVSSMFLLNVVSSWLFLLCMFLNVCVLFQEIVSVRCFAVVWLGYTSQLVIRKIICVLCNDPSVDFSCFWRGIKSDVAANIDTDRCLLKRPPVFN